MQTTERQRLVSTMSVAPTYGLGSVLKCGICLAFLLLLVAIGSAREQAPIAQEARKDAPHSKSAAGMYGAAAHRKEVFDGRRAKLMSKASEPGVTGPTLPARADVVAP